jgi:hypothetical protein
MTFNPATDLSNLAGWWDASVFASLTLSGSSVTDVADQSGAGNNILNHSGSFRPTYSAATGLNSLPAIVFTPFNFLGNTSFPMGTGNTLTLFAVAEMISGTDPFGRLVCYISPGHSDNDSVNSWTITRNNSPQIQFYRNGTLVLGNMTLATPYRIIVTVNASGVMTIYMNGVASATATLSGNWTTNGTLSVGTLTNGASWKGPLYELGIATGDNTSSVSSLDSYLGVKWGLILPSRLWRHRTDGGMWMRRSGVWRRVVPDRRRIIMPEDVRNRSHTRLLRAA